ncbi:uncharacterized protein LOC128882649 [Hylaeus volcanicus]|uniref:uncharacterized protein LOC128882649 n=1 Tax=Hylaeus volcanicus TaxID=313075 RepID=UPI0023B8492E|nr:uncharacterized protein LOC128882649 [Hylaeus volcanicus]
MPVVLVLAEKLHDELQIKDVSELESFCFNYGLEYDGKEWNDEGEACYRIEVPSNRVDLLCGEGICQALNVFLKEIEPPTFFLQPSSISAITRIDVKPLVSKIRPFIFGAILRDIQFTKRNFKSFIDLQEKLHQTIARKRQLVAIGTHDLDTVVGPFVYEAQAPNDIQFVPLYESKPLNGPEIMETLSTHAQLKTYLPLIIDSPVYPVIRDANGTVLSLPPIINSKHSKITITTRNVFIEVTALDAFKGSTVLNTLLTAFSEYCSTPFSIEPVQVCYDENHSLLPNKKFVNPIFKTNVIETTTDYIKEITGIPNLTAISICNLLKKMMIKAQPIENEKIKAIIPVTRSDILHPCDLAEDVAIAYGFNNISQHSYTCVSDLPITHLSKRLRDEFTQCGYHECLTWGLCSIKEASTNFGAVLSEECSLESSTQHYLPWGSPILVSNPKTKEFEMVRVSLIPSLLKSLAANSSHELPIKLFEIGDCVTRDATSVTGGRLRRYCAALIANNSGSGLESLHGLLDHLLESLGLTAEYEEYQLASHCSVTRFKINPKKIYSLSPTNEKDKSFLPRRRVEIMVQPENVCIGRMGVVHPSTLKAFGINIPCSVFEFSLDPFLKWLTKAEIDSI